MPLKRERLKRLALDLAKSLGNPESAFLGCHAALRTRFDADGDMKKNANAGRRGKQSIHALKFIRLG